MAQQNNQKHFRRIPERNVYRKKSQAKEVKILNTDPNQLQNTDFETLILDVVITANAFKSALKKLRIDDYDNKVQKKEIIKVLADTQNMIKLKILSLKKGQGNKEREEESSKTRNTQGSPLPNIHSWLSFLPELSSEKSLSPEWTKNNSSDVESEAFSTSKLMSLSKNSLCSARSSQNDASVYDGGDAADSGDDDDADDYDDEKFKEFLASVNCPFCLRREDNKNSLVKHLDTDCTSFKNKTFVKSSDCPYSVFQILPSNKFKCNVCPRSIPTNLKKYFVHSQSATHISLLNKAALHKNYVESIFCSACKISVPNNVTQILFHLEHEVHERNRKHQYSTSFYRQRGIQCVYNKDKKFKCLNCPPGRAIHKSVKEILRHLESKEHVKNAQSQKGRLPSVSTMYCMFCLEEVNGFNVIGHLNSSGHVQKEREEENNKFELCFYCDFKCSDLHALALHTKDCPAIDLIRQEGSHQKCERVDGVLTQVEKEQERPTKENTSEEGRCIIVKDYNKILELYNYFKRFGEVLEIERYGENAIVIKFQDEKTVDIILESQRPIEINGVKLKITRKEDLERSDKVLESSRTAERTDSSPAGSKGGIDDSFASLAGRNLAGVSNSTVKENFSEVAVDGGTLENLFNRVSSHLLYNSVKPNCEDVLNIALDCERILKLGKCHSTGFLKCGLSFPVEEITFYCELSDSLIKEQCSDVSSTSLTESILFNKNMCKKCVKLFNEAAEVKLTPKVIENPFPLVKFFHLKTQRHCSITFRQSGNILADELRYCLEGNSKLHSFVLIIRFWLSVHQLEIRNFESVIISLLLFFLLRSGIVKTCSENLKLRPAHEELNNSVTHLERDCVGNNKNMGKLTTRPNIEHKNSVMELFQRFLLFLNQFDFENTAICLPLSYPVPKTKLFQGCLKKYVCQWGNPKPPICIMDPFLFNNLAEDVREADRDSLLKTVRETVEHYCIH